MIETSSLRRKLLDLAITGKLVPRTGEWKTIRLGEVCDILTGNVFDSRLFTQSGVKICGGLIIAPDRIVWEECKHWTSTAGLEKYELADGDVVVALDRPWISTGAKIGLIHKSDLPCLLIQRTARLRSKEIEPLFLKILLASDDFKNHCVPTGSMLPHISHKDIASFEVSLPPLAEQKAIVKRLDELLALEREIAADSTAVDDLVASAKRKVLQLAVSGKLISRGERGDRGEKGTSDYTDCGNGGRVEVEKCRDGRAASPLAAVGGPHSVAADGRARTPAAPRGWKTVKLADIISLISGTSYGKGDVTDSGIRILRGGNIHSDNKISREEDDVFVSEIYRDIEKSPRKTDIVIVASTGSISVIGRAGIPHDDMLDSQIGAFLRIVRPHDDSLSAWLRLIFLGDMYKKHIEESAKGTNIKNIKANYMLDFSIPLPPLAEQKGIVAKVDELFSVLDAMKRSQK